MSHGKAAAEKLASMLTLDYLLQETTQSKHEDFDCYLKTGARGALIF